MEAAQKLDRRDFIKSLGACSVLAGGVLLGRPTLGSENKAGTIQAPPPVETNIQDFLKVPKGPHAIPGPFPGRVVQVTDPRALAGDAFDAKVIAGIVDKGIGALTGKNLKDSFPLFFESKDIVGIKVNPVGPPLINTRVEVVEEVIRWLVDCGLPPGNIVIWDRFEHMLKDAGFTSEHFPKVRIEGLQMMDEQGQDWKDASGKHKSEANFDLTASYFAKGVFGQGVKGYDTEDAYRNQHVFAGEHSYFGKLVTQRLTKIINIPVFKNTGQAVSMATKNLAYGSICNTARLHAPLFLKVCTEVLAAPALRDKLVLNILDGLRGQFDGGPMPAASFVYPYGTLYFATDPFALDRIGHTHLVDKRKAMKVAVNEHPMFTDYLAYGESLGLGVADPKKIQLVVVKA